MTQTKGEITHLALWCQDARKTMNMGLHGDSSTMKNLIKDVETQLKKLSESRTNQVPASVACGHHPAPTGR